MTKTNYYQIAESFGISYTFVSYYYLTMTFVFYQYITCIEIIDTLYWNNRYLNRITDSGFYLRRFQSAIHKHSRFRSKYSPGSR